MDEWLGCWVIKSLFFVGFITMPNLPVTSIRCESCQSFDVVDDYSTGDSICRDCGVVNDRLMNQSFSGDQHSECCANKYESFIRKFCKNHNFDECTIQSVLEYTNDHPIEFNDLKTIIYAVHLIETNDDIHTFVKKRKMDTTIIQQVMNDIKKKYRIENKQYITIDTNEDTWIRTLYDEIIKMSMSHCIHDIPKRTLMDIKKEIHTLVKMKPEALFYNSSVLATVLLVKHEIPIEHKLPRSKIRKIMKELFV